MFKSLTFGVFLAGVFYCSTITSGAEGWVTDYETAAKQAKEEGKDLLLEFTGSDWCPPCKELARTITGKNEFVTSISESLCW